MRRDPTEFRQRFQRWKNGQQVYKDGLPHYEDGKDSYPILGGKVIEDALKEQYRYNNDIEYRFKIKDRNLPEASEIKIPFINNKRIVLTNAGLSTGAVISENMLDTIAKYAKAAGIPIKTALGIAAKESTLGNPTDDRSVYKILNKESAAYFKKMGTAQHINVGDQVNGRELVNFYVDTDPVYYAAKQYAKKHSINNEDYLNKLKGGEKYADLQASQRERFRNKNVIQAAFEYYRDFPHKYNPGQKNYQQLVNKRGDELMSSPEVQNWYKQLPHYEGGKDARKLEHHPEEDYYYGGNLFGKGNQLVVTGQKKDKPYWVSPKSAGNMTVMPGDPEMVFFAPIAAGAAVAASPTIASALGSTISGINTVGDALAATAAGQRLTSGLNFAANAVGSSKAWPWINTGLSSLFAAHGADKIRRGDIHNVGDVAEIGLDLLPLTQLRKPIINAAGRIATNADINSPFINKVSKKDWYDLAVGETKDVNIIPFDYQFKSLTPEQQLSIMLEKKSTKYGTQYFKIKPEYEPYVDDSDFGLGISKSGDNYFYNYYKDEFFKDTPLLRPGQSEKQLLGEIPTTPKHITIKPEPTDWSNYQEYKKQLEDVIMEDWNNNGALRSHLERSGITDPMVIFDYIASPETAWKEVFSKPGILDFEGQHIKKTALDTFFKRNPEIADAVAQAEEYLKKVSSDKGVLYDTAVITDIKDQAFNQVLSLVDKEKLKTDLYDVADQLYDINNAFAHRASGKIYIPTGALKRKDLRKTITEVISHEFGHLEDQLGLRKDAVGVLESLQNSVTPSSKSPLFKAAFNIERRGIPSNYFGRLSNDATEMAQRATQLKDYFRLKPGEKLTMQQLKYAAKHYSKDVMNNNMNQFFKTIKDYEYALQWINAHGKAIIPPAGGAYLYKHSADTDLQNK